MNQRTIEIEYDAQAAADFGYGSSIAALFDAQRMNPLKNGKLISLQVNKGFIGTNSTKPYKMAIEELVIGLRFLDPSGNPIETNQFNLVNKQASITEATTQIQYFSSAQGICPLGLQMVDGIEVFAISVKTQLAPLGTDKCFFSITLLFE